MLLTILHRQIYCMPGEVKSRLVCSVKLSLSLLFSQSITSTEHHNEFESEIIQTSARKCIFYLITNK